MSSNELTLIIIVCAVTIVGVNGNGNDKYDDTLSKAIQIAIFVKSFVFMTIPHFLIRKSPNNQRFVSLINKIVKELSNFSIIKFISIELKLHLNSRSSALHFSIELLVLLDHQYLLLKLHTSVDFV